MRDYDRVDLTGRKEAGRGSARSSYALAKSMRLGEAHQIYGILLAGIPATPPHAWRGKGEALASAAMLRSFGGETSY